MRWCGGVYSEYFSIFGVISGFYGGNIVTIQA